VSGKGKAGPLEVGRGKYSPPANPERVTSKALKRRDNGVLSTKTESFMKSKGYSNPTNKNQETPVKRGASNYLTRRAKKCNFLLVSIPLAALIFKHLPRLKRSDMKESQLVKTFSQSLDKFWVPFPMGV
jgi:hypothetical protein